MGRKKRSRYDKYGIYEIPSYNNKKRKRRHRKKNSLSVASVIKLLTAVLSILIIIYGVSFGVKYSMKDEAVSLYEKGDYQGAIGLFDEALKPMLPFMESFDKDVRLYMADCYIDVEDYGAACQQYGLIRLWSDNVGEDIRNLENIAYGLQLYYWKDYRAALPILLKAYESGNSNLILYVGSCYGQTGDLENMQLYYDVFLKTHEMNSFMYAQYAALAINNEDMEKALDYIESGKKLQDQSNISEILYDEIVYYEKMKDYNTAFEKAEKFIELYPDDTEGRNEYDLLYTRQTLKKK